MTIVAEPAVADLHSVVEEVWASFLGGADLLPVLEETEPVLAWTAAITVSGGWQAMVRIQVSDLAARGVAEQMLGLAPDEDPSAEDLTDSLGELVNIVGGNVKSLMPGPSQLSLPLVANGTVTSSPSGGELVEACRLDLIWNGEPVRVTVSVDTTAPQESS